MRTFDDYLKHLEQERPDLIQGMLEEEQRMDAKNRCKIVGYSSQQIAAMSRLPKKKNCEKSCINNVIQTNTAPSHIPSMRARRCVLLFKIG